MISICRRYLQLPVICLILVPVPLGLFAQEIENIHPEIIGDRIHVSYDLTGIPAGQPLFVSVYLSTDGGLSYGEPLKNVTGDVGLVIGPGLNRRIIWDVFEEVDELSGVDVKFMIKADPLRSEQEKGSIVRGYTVNLNPELSRKVELGSYGANLKFTVYLGQLGLGVRGLYYRNFDVKNDNGYYWGFSGGVIIDYDLIRTAGFSLYPFMYAGQTKILWERENLTGEISGYSIIYSPGIGFNARLAEHIYLGVELEYCLAPRVELVDRESNLVERNIIMDGLSLGVVLKFAKLQN